MPKRKTCIWKGCENDVHARGCCLGHYTACYQMVADESKPNITWEELENRGVVLPLRAKRTTLRSDAKRKILEMIEEKAGGRGWKGRRKAGSNT